jgi:hypothetical protein
VPEEYTSRLPWGVGLRGDEPERTGGHSDDDRVPTRTKVGIQTRPVDATTVLAVTLKAGGGQAIWIEPER